MNIGEYVLVKPDLSKGKKSYGGQGWISDVDKHNNTVFYTINYIDGQTHRKESYIPINRLSLCMPPQQTAQITGARKSRQTVTSTNPKKCSRKQQKSTTGSTMILADQILHTIRYNKKCGWRKIELNFTGTKKGNNPGFNLVFS